MKSIIILLVSVLILPTLARAYTSYICEMGNDKVAMISTWYDDDARYDSYAENGIALFGIGEKDHGFQGTPFFASMAGLHDKYVDENRLGVPFIVHSYELEQTTGLNSFYEVEGPDFTSVFVNLHKYPDDSVELILTTYWGAEPVFDETYSCELVEE